ARVTETLAGADRLAQIGMAAEVVCVTSPGLLFDALQSRHGLNDAPAWILEQVFPSSRSAPTVTVLDGHPHTLAFLATINNVPVKSLGVSRFGQVGSLDAVYRYHGIGTDTRRACARPRPGAGTHCGTGNPLDPYSPSSRCPRTEATFEWDHRATASPHPPDDRPANDGLTAQLRATHHRARSRRHLHRQSP